MAVAYQSDGATVWCAANNNNAVTVPLPATRPVGSVLLFVAWNRLITATVATAPSGYTLLGTFTSATANGGRIWLYAKQVVGGETDPSFASTGTTGTSGDIWGACIYCYSGVDLSGGIAAILDGTTTQTDAAGTTTCTYPAQTIGMNDSMLIGLLARFRDAADTFTPTATWNEREDASTTNRLGGQHHLQDKLATANGVIAAVTVAPSNTTSSRYLALSLALRAYRTVAIGKRAAGTVVRGVTPSGAGTAPVTIGRVSGGTAASYDAAVIADTPAQLFKLEDVSGTGVADTIGGVDGGSYVGTVAKGVAGPWPGMTAVDFSGDAGHAQCVATVSGVPGTDVTVEWWQKWNVTPVATGDAVAFIAGAEATNYAVWYNGADRFGFNTYNGDTFGIAGAAAALGSSWHHVVATFRNNDRSACRLWIDGVEQTMSVDNVEGPSNDATASFRIGRGQGPAHGWDGPISRVALYNGPLTQAQIDRHLATQLVRVRGVTPSSSGGGPTNVPIGKVGATAVVRGVTPSGVGTTAFTIGKRVAAPTVRGVTPTGVGTATPVVIGKKLAATVVRGVTPTGVGTATPVVIGKRVAAPTVRGVTPTGVGTATPVVIGKKLAATVVRGVTPTGVGTATPVVIGKRAAAITVRGVTPTGAGTVAFAIGRVGGSAASDDFNRADGSLSTPWVQTGDGTAAIASNVVVNGTPGNDCYPYYAAAASVADQFAEALIEPSGTVGALTGSQSGPAVRVTAGKNAYFVNPSFERLVKLVGGSYTDVGTMFASASGGDPFDFRCGDVVRLEVEGTTLRVFLTRAGTFAEVEVPDSPFTDSALATGQPGLRIWDDTTDAFAGGDLAGALVEVYGVTVTGGPATIVLGPRAATTVVRGVTPTAVGAVAVTLGKRVAAQTVRGITVSAAGTVSVTIGKRTAAAAVRGLTLAPAGAAPVVLGKRTAATVVRGLTLAGVGTAAPVTLGKRTAAVAVRGLTLAPSGAAPVTLGKRTAATVVRGVTPTGVGTAAPVVLGKLQAATVVRGLTLFAEGTGLVLGKRQAATVVRGVTPTGVGTVAFAVGKRAAAAAVRGVTVTAAGAVAVTLGKRTQTLTVRGVTVVPAPAVVPIGKRTPATVVRGLTVTGGAVAVPVGRVTSSSQVRGVGASGTGIAVFAIGRRLSATTVRGVLLIPAGVAPIAVGRVTSGTTIYGLQIVEKAAIEWADRITLATGDAAGITASAGGTTIRSSPATGGTSIGSGPGGVTVGQARSTGTTIRAD